MFEKFNKIRPKCYGTMCWRVLNNFCQSFGEKILNLRKCLVWSGAEVRKSCRSQACCKQFFLQKIGFEKAENEPSKVIFWYSLIPQILKYTRNISSSSFRGLPYLRMFRCAPRAGLEMPSFPNPKTLPASRMCSTSDVSHRARVSCRAFTLQLDKIVTILRNSRQFIPSHSCANEIPNTASRSISTL